MFWALVRLGLGGCEDLRTLLTSALSSSASCWLSLVQAASMAVMYSKLGGCLGVTAKLGPFSQNRPLHWSQRFLGQVNDPLRVGFFNRRTLAGPTGGVWRRGYLPWRLRRPQGKVEWVDAWGGCLEPCLLALGGYYCALTGMPYRIEDYWLQEENWLGKNCFLPLR